VETSASFHQAVLAEADFRAGDVDTAYLEHHPAVLEPAPATEAARAAAIVAVLLEEQRRRRAGGRIPGAAHGNQSPGAWREHGWRW
jgi:acetyl/propionyl-CoA carboxylase alpha subunit